jgi:hypothetical protein
MTELRLKAAIAEAPAIADEQARATKSSRSAS